MGKLDRSTHRYIVAIISWLHVSIAILLALSACFVKYHVNASICAAIVTLIGSFGLFSLWKENRVTMFIFGILLIILVVPLVCLTLYGILLVMTYLAGGKEVLIFIGAIVCFIVSISSYISAVVSAFALVRAFGSRKEPIGPSSIPWSVLTSNKI